MIVRQQTPDRGCGDARWCQSRWNRLPGGEAGGWRDQWDHIPLHPAPRRRWNRL